MNTAQHMYRLARAFYLIIALLVAALIAIKSLDYLAPDFQQGFLLDKESIFPLYKYFLYAHMVSAPIALLTGAFQVTFPSSSYHKYFGRIYLGAVLLLGAPSGLYMSFFAVGGLWSVISFFLLSSFWGVFTALAYLKIKVFQIDAHKKFMYRSYVLTNSAILIRILSWFNNHYQLADPVEGYVIISWISWLAPLLLFEFWSSRRAT